MIVLRALREMRPRLDACNYLGEGGDVQPIIRQVTSALLLRDAAVQRAAQSASTPGETVFAWKMRLRTRDLLRIMNCVKNRAAHGKVAALGVSSALQVLLGTRGAATAAISRATCTRCTAGGRPRHHRRQVRPRVRDRRALPSARGRRAAERPAQHVRGREGVGGASETPLLSFVLE